jgi:chromosome segregation ATPase
MNDETYSLTERCNALASEFADERNAWRKLHAHCKGTQENVENLVSAIAGVRKQIEALSQDPTHWPIDGILRAVHQRSERVHKQLAAVLNDLQQRAEEPVEALDTSFSSLSGNAEAMIESIEPLATDIIAAVTDTQSGIAEACDQVCQRASEFAAHAEVELQQAFEDGLDDAFADFAELADHCSERGDEIFRGIDDKVVDAVEETSEYLTGLSEKLGETLEVFSGQYREIVDDLTGLGDDLEKIHAVVTTAMEGSGVGMETAAGALTDLRNAMSGVS